MSVCAMDLFPRTSHSHHWQWPCPGDCCRSGSGCKYRNVSFYFWITSEHGCAAVFSTCELVNAICMAALVLGRALHELLHLCPGAGSLTKFLPSGLHGNRGLSTWFNHPCWLFWLQEQGRKSPRPVPGAAVSWGGAAGRAWPDTSTAMQALVNLAWSLNRLMRAESCSLRFLWGYFSSPFKAFDY